jgi:hypothetical protein
MTKFAAKLPIWIADRKVHAAAKARAKRDGVSLSAFAEDALRAYVAQRSGADTGPGTPPVVRLRSPRVVQPVSARDINAALGVTPEHERVAAAAIAAVRPVADTCRKCHHARDQHRAFGKAGHLKCQRAACNCGSYMA